MEEEKIAELVAQDFRRASILQDLGIDVFSGAKQTLEEYCRNRLLDLVRIVAELKNNQSLERASSFPFNAWPIDFLSSYIVKRHHRYVYESLPLILDLAEKITDETEDKAFDKVFQVIRRMARAMWVHLM